MTQPAGFCRRIAANEDRAGDFAASRLARPLDRNSPATFIGGVSTLWCRPRLRRPITPQQQEPFWKPSPVKFSLSQDFPVSLDVLWPVYGSPAYLEAKYKALGSTNLRILEAKTDDTSINVVLERTIAPDLRSLPDWARKMVARDYVMRHENRCQRSSPTHASVSLGIKPLGSPVDIHGRGSLSEPAPGQTRLALEFDVECRIPLVGKKVAELFAIKIREALAEDHDFTLAYIKEHGSQ